MLSYLLKLRIKKIIAPNGKIRWIQPIGLILIWFNAYLFSRLAAITGNTNIINYILFISVILVFLRNLIPFYRPSSWFLSRYPGNSIKKASAQIIFEIISPFFIFLLAFHLSLLFLKTYSIIIFCFASMAILYAFLLEKIVKLLLEKENKSIWLTVVLINVCIAFFFIERQSLFLLHPANTLTLIAAGSLLNYFTIVVYVRRYNFVDAKNNITLDRISSNKNNSFSAPLIIVKRKSLRLPLVVCFIFKTLIFLGNSYPQLAKHNAIKFDWLTCISLSPVLLYTYIYNNFFGYTREFAYYFSIYRNKWPVFKIYLSALLIPLIVDFIVSFVFDYCFSDNSSRFLLGYLYIGIGAFLVGFYSSIQFPSLANTKIELQKLQANSNIWISIITIFLPIIIFTALNENIKLFGIIFLVLELTAVIYFFKYLKNDLNRPLLFSGLFKSKKS